MKDNQNYLLHFLWQLSNWFRNVASTNLQYLYYKEDEKLKFLSTVSVMIYISYTILCYGLSSRRLIRIAFTQRINRSTLNPIIHTFCYLLPLWNNLSDVEEPSAIQYELWCTRTYRMVQNRGNGSLPTESWCTSLLLEYEFMGLLKSC